MAATTLRDVAEHLGMGKSTVQRVLAGIGSVSPRTRKRVTDAAAKLGYKPNPLFSILGSQKRRHSLKSMKIAYLHREGFHAGTGYFPSAAARGKALGYHVEEIELAKFAADTRLMDVLYHRGFAGVLIGRVPTSDHAAILTNKHLPVVCCGRIAPLPIHTIQADMTDMVRLAWNSMLKAGYRRIGAAIGTHVPVLEDDRDRFGTVLQCQVDTLPVRNRIPPLRAPFGDHKALLEWFHKYQPDSILGFTEALYYPLHDSGVDMSRIGYASLHSSEEATFAGIIEPVDSISREAVNLLDQLIRHRSVGMPAEPLHILLPGIWRDGPTLLPKASLTPAKK